MVPKTTPVAETDIEKALALIDSTIEALGTNNIMKCAFILGHLKALLEKMPGCVETPVQPLEAIPHTQQEHPCPLPTYPVIEKDVEPGPILQEVQDINEISPETLKHASKLLAGIDLNDMDKVKQLLNNVRARVSGAYQRVSEGVKSQFYRWRVTLHPNLFIR